MEIREGMKPCIGCVNSVATIKKTAEKTDQASF